MSDATITFPLLGEGFKLDFPPYFTIFGWRFYWYGAIVALGFLLAVLYGLRRSKQFGFTQDNLIDMLIRTVPRAIICTRLFYVVFYRDADVNPYFDVSTIRGISFRSGTGVWPSMAAL
jgi:phosphatidylglycerol:prolipoprotein diacylglycerol transferase